MFFRIEPDNGVAIYDQIARQIKYAVANGAIRVGELVPSVRELAVLLAVNPNTVAKAYRELEREGLVSARPGRGTFVASTLAADSLEHHESLRRALVAWLRDARRAGIDDESILALISSTLREALGRRVA